MRCLTVCFSFVLILLALSGEARAFHEIESFDRIEKGGGGGAFFTGSPRFKGYDCRICHTKTEDKISISLEVNRPEFSQGIYEPNTGYDITVKLIGEHRGLESAFNPNTFMLEIVNDQGESMGDYLPGSAAVELVDDRRVIAAEGFGEGENEWSFTWFTPREPAGPLTLYMGMLDGDGAGETEIRFIDPLNDDVATLELRLCPLGQPCPQAAGDPEIESAVHCGITGSSSLHGSAILWLTIVFGLVMSRRSFTLGLIALLLGLSGCGSVDSSQTTGPQAGTGLPAFELRYGLAPDSGTSEQEVQAALEKSLPIVRQRADSLQLPQAKISREGNEILVRIPGGSELSAVDLRAALAVRGKLDFRLVRHEGEFMPKLCASLSADSKAGVMRIETGTDVWQDGTGAHVKQCYIAANDRVAMLNAQEAQAEGCRWRGDTERMQCVVSGRTILMRYLEGRGDVVPEPGYRLAFEGTASSDDEGQRYWRSYYIQDASTLDGSSIASVKVEQNPDLPEALLRLTFDEAGRKRLNELTQKNIGRKLGILIDDRVVSAPIIREAVDGGVLSLELGPTSESARVLAAALRSGPLPVALVEMSAASEPGSTTHPNQ